MRVTAPEDVTVMFIYGLKMFTLLCVVFLQLTSIIFANRCIRTFHSSHLLKKKKETSLSFCALSVHFSSRIRSYKMDAGWRLICCNKQCHYRIQSAFKTGNDTSAFCNSEYQLYYKKRFSLKPTVWGSTSEMYGSIREITSCSFPSPGWNISWFNQLHK